MECSGKISKEEGITISKSLRTPKERYEGGMGWSPLLTLRAVQVGSELNAG